MGSSSVFLIPNSYSLDRECLPEIEYTVCAHILHKMIKTLITVNSCGQYRQFGNVKGLRSLAEQNRNERQRAKTPERQVTADPKCAAGRKRNV